MAHFRGASLDFLKGTLLLASSTGLCLTLNPKEESKQNFKTLNFMNQWQKLFIGQNSILGSLSYNRL